MSSDLAGAHVIVTGASGALGAAVVHLLLERGASLHLPVFEPEVPSHLRIPHVDAEPGIALTDEAAVERFFSSRPPPSASIHLAGGFAMSPVVDTRLDDYERMHSINAVTCFLACREAV